MRGVAEGRMILGVLDQSPIRSGGTATEAIQETLVLAEHADRLGYSRYWLAEHHSSGGLAGAAPEVLMGQVAARTSRIRVGSGGVMLSHYSPLKVAENFRVLEALFPGRIDLGIGRAPGSDQRTARALRHGPGAVPLEHFPQQLADLIGFLHDELPSGHPFGGVRAMPAGPTAPPIWMLGSSGDGAALAAHFGTAFSYAHFINAVGGVDAMRAYRESVPAVATSGVAQASVAVFALCAETEEAAERLARCRDLFIVRLYTGRFGPFPSVEEAEAYTLLGARARDRGGGAPAHGGGHAGAGEGAPRGARRRVRGGRAGHRHHHPRRSRRACAPTSCSRRRSASSDGRSSAPPRPGWRRGSGARR